MTWISIILFILKEIPDLIAIIRAIIQALHGKPGELQAFREKLRQAIQSGNLEAVKQVISDEQQCVGVACPADLKGE